MPSLASLYRKRTQKAPAETFGSLCEAHDQFDNFYEYCRLYRNEKRSRTSPVRAGLWGVPFRHAALALQPWIDLRVTRNKFRDRLAVRARDLVH
jgi:hypothetical protein